MSKFVKLARGEGRTDTVLVNIDRVTYVLENANDPNESMIYFGAMVYDNKDADLSYDWECVAVPLDALLAIFNAPVAK